MKKEIIVNHTPEEIRVAVMEDGRLVEYLIERPALGMAKLVGNIYKGRIENVLPGISSAFVNVGYEKNAYLYVTDVVSDAKERHIEKMLQRGDPIMVQVAKEAIGTKGMKVTMDISLPGRYLIYMPKSEHLGVSKNIEDAAERDRLRRAIEKTNPIGGVIVRTEAEGAEERELAHEMRYLMRLWENIQKKYESTAPGALIHRELGLTFQVARDLLTDNAHIFLVDSQEEFKDLRGFVEMLAPELADRVQHYTGRTPIFQAFGVEKELSQLRHQRINLPSGGYIIIQEAESLCAIDVNTGKFIGHKSQEETVTATNLEAAAEVARQLRLRNIGGIIVIDFIDMRRRRNQHKVVEALQHATRNDRAKIKILPITRLGLVEMTRERRRESLLSLMTEPCRECDGSGRVLSRESLYLKIQSEIEDLTKGRTDGTLKVSVPPVVGDFLRERQERLEKNLQRSIEVQIDPTLPWEDYRILIE
ncbi:MAG TPA: Rne/Rng family ribonuclease [Elusimicrobiota bacterium]|nr:Rne/Rng family ribonuclease [Elusimicrobiota bacterium]